MKKLFYFYSNEKNKNNPLLLIGLFLILIYLLLLIKTAWIGDDAYITFRTIDNFVNGFGLRWNIAERVQSYTHPLWLFLLSIFFFFTREIFFTSLIISIIVSLSAVSILAFKLSVSWKNMTIVLLSVIFSKAFIDYSTSGLENPLTNLLLVLFACVYFNIETGKAKIFFLSLLSALVLVNRMDNFLLLLPVYIYYIFKDKAYKNYYIILIGFSPFIFWELFSLFYYGFPFPNTAYAKLNTGIDKSDLIIQGFKYFYSSFKLDQITLFIIFLLIVLSTMKDNRKYLPFASGIICYLLYTIWIGGDFMAGRFFSSPFLVAVIILSQIKFNTAIESISFALIIVLVGFFSLKNTLVKKYTEIDKFGICDERLIYYSDSNLLDGFKGEKMPSFIWAEWGRQTKENNLLFIKFSNTGFYGYFVGSQCYVIDELALTDPLLSRIPAEKNWRIGHFKRQIPDGYEETLKSGINEIKNADLARFYDKISLITRGSLVNLNRLDAIWKINTGQFSYLIKRFINSNNTQ